MTRASSSANRNGIALGIVASEFNARITRQMLKRALRYAKLHRARVAYIYKVPGAFDMPLAVKELLQRDEVDAVVTIGAVLKGETRHDIIVAENASRMITELSLMYGKPVTLGVSGPGMSEVQGLARIDEYARRSVESAIKLVRRLRRIRSNDSPRSERTLVVS